MAIIDFIIAFAFGMAAGIIASPLRRHERRKLKQTVAGQQIIIDQQGNALSEQRRVIDSLNGMVCRLNKKLNETGTITTLEQLENEKLQ